MSGHRSLLALLALAGLVASLSVGGGSASADPTVQSNLFAQCSPDPTTPNVATTCTAYVSGPDASSSAPTGTVTFQLDTFAQGSLASNACTLASVNPNGLGTATCSVEYDPVGTGNANRRDGMIADYSGSDTYLAATARFGVTVGTKTATKFLLNCTIGYETQKSDCQLLATGVVRPPTGTVKFGYFGVNGQNLPGVFSPASCTLKTRQNTDSACSVTYTPKAGPPGGTSRQDGILATYVGDSLNAGGSTAYRLNVAALKEPSLTLNCSPSDVVAGGPTICDVYGAREASTPGSPSGTITFKFTATRGRSGTFTPKSSCVLVQTNVNFSTCSVLFTPGGITLGSRLVSANYPGDAYYRASSTVANVNEVAKGSAAAVSVVGCEDDTVLAGDSMFCTAQVIGNSGSAPTGILVFKSANATLTGLFANACRLAPLAPNISISTCEFGFVPKGAGSPTRQDTVSWTYAGDGVYGAAPGSRTIHVAALPPTNVTASCNPDPVVVNTTTTCTVTVSEDPLIANSSPPGGTVTFGVGATLGKFTPTACTLVAVSDLESQCSVQYKPTGSVSPTRSDPFTVTYAGDTEYERHAAVASHVGVVLNT